MESDSRPTVALLALIALSGVAARLAVSTLGENYDMESWWLVSSLVLDGESFYASTHRYNYGPLWAVLLGAARALSRWSGEDTIHRFHFVVAALLSLFDVATAGLLLRRCGRAGFAFLMLNPVSVLITGYHSQMDGVALFFAVAFWLRFASAPPTLGVSLSTGALLGVSLVAKHILLPFVPWMLLVRRPFLKFFPGALAAAACAAAVFGLSFLPWAFDPASLAGLRANVVEYRSTEGLSLLAMLWPLPASAFPMRSAFLLLLSLAGVATACLRHAWRDDLFSYLLILVALSSGVQDHYLAIPLVSLALSLASPLAWGYVFAATATLLVSGWNIGYLLGIPPAPSAHAALFVTAQGLALLLGIATVRRAMRVPPRAPATR